jgi:hypothetical protein
LHTLLLLLLLLLQLPYGFKERSSLAYQHCRMARIRVVIVEVAAMAAVTATSRGEARWRQVWCG